MNYNSNKKGTIFLNVKKINNLIIKTLNKFNENLTFLHTSQCLILYICTN
ncbi:hypothetical protein EMIT036CA2_20692 [Chryseobacterium sp. IT-36CA2]